MTLRIASLALLAGLAAPHATAQTTSLHDHRDGDRDVPIVTHDFVLQLKRGEHISEVLEDYGEFNATITSSMPSHRLYALRLYIPIDDDSTEGTFDSDDRFEDEQRNEDNISSDGHTQSFFFRIASTPEQFDTQTSRHQIGLDTLPRGVRGSGVIVAVLDTGISEHPILEGKLAAGGWNFVDDSADTSDLCDGRDNDGNGLIDELAGHGTFVAGLISWVAPGAIILPIKVLDSDGHGNTFTTAAGVYHAVDQGAKVINLSLSLPADSTVLRSAIAYATSRGVIVVSAVGNAGLLVPDYPAANPSVIGVTAVDANDTLAFFANKDASVALCAPGTHIVGPTLDGGFARTNGTSFAAAQVAGVAALAAARFPLETPIAIRQRIFRASRNINALNPLDLGLFGAGRLDTRWLFNAMPLAPAASMSKLPR